MHSNGAIRLLRSGIVPAQQVRNLSVGYGKLESYITKHLRAFCYGEQIEPPFVRGEWGSGKSHFLAYVQSAALQGGVPVASLALNARTTALNYPQRLFAQLSAGLRYGDCLGLRDFLISKVADSKFRSDLVGALGKSDSPLAGALHYLCDQFIGKTQNLSAMRSSFAWTIILGADIAWRTTLTREKKRLIVLKNLQEFAAVPVRTG
jgi:P-loop Domain of unknown function (DUF2791)